MKKKVTILVSMMVSTALVSAQEIPIVLPQPLLDSIQSLTTKVSILAGGLFGLYVILILIRTYYERKKVRLLEDIRKDVDLLTKHFGVKHAHEKGGIFRRIFGFLLHDEESKKIKK